MRDEDDSMRKQIKALEGKNSVYQQQLRDVKDIKTQLSDQRNIEIKKIDKKTFDEALKFVNANPSDEVASFLIGTLTQIIHGDSNYKRTAGDAEWKNLEAAQEALRNADVKKMDKAWIRENMEKITGESGVPAEDGAIYKLISDPANTKKYWCYVPFFKVLSKTLHLGMMLKKEDEMQKRVYTNERSINQMNVKIKVSDSLGDSTVYRTLAEEVKRSQHNELAHLKGKRDRLLKEKAQIEQTDHFAWYFQDLF
jgi:hypothetical protein